MDLNHLNFILFTILF